MDREEAKEEEVEEAEAEEAEAEEAEAEEAGEEEAEETDEEVSSIHSTDSPQHKLAKQKWLNFEVYIFCFFTYVLIIFFYMHQNCHVKAEKDA